MKTKVEPTVEKWEFKCDRCKKVEKVPEFVAEHLRGKNPPWCNKCEDEYRYWLNNPNQAHSVQEAKAEERQVMITKLHNIRSKIHGYISLTELTDLLASLKQEESK